MAFKDGVGCPVLHVTETIPTIKNVLIEKGKELSWQAWGQALIREADVAGWHLVIKHQLKLISSIVNRLGCLKPKTNPWHIFLPILGVLNILVKFPMSFETSECKIP